MLLSTGTLEKEGGVTKFPKKSLWDCLLLSSRRNGGHMPPPPPSDSADDRSAGMSPGGFPRTSWTLVRAAQSLSRSKEAMKALNAWCSTYRKPIVVAVRARHGLSAADAEDVAQEFIAWLLNEEHLHRAEQMAGSKFRTFLLTYLGHFVGNWKQRMGAEKRGGKAGEHLLVHDSGDESMPATEIPVEASQDDEVDRAWVVATLRDVRERMKADYKARGKAAECAVLLKSLSVTEPMNMASLSTQLGVSEGAFKVRVHRFRLEFRELLTSVVREMVSCEADLEDEMALIRKYAGE